MKYYAFIKAINVGGNSNVDMTRLKKVLSSESITEVTTYLNSGNIIMESDLSEKELEKTVTEMIKNEFKLAAAVFVKTRKQIEQAINSLPFKTEENEKSKQLVYFLTKSVDASKYDPIRNNTAIDESFYPKSDLLYVYYKNGVGRSKFTANYIDKVLEVKSTGRNINTIEKVLKK